MGKNIAETVVPEWGLDKMNRVISDLIKDRGNWDGEFLLQEEGWQHCALPSVL